MFTQANKHLWQRGAAIVAVPAVAYAGFNYFLYNPDKSNCANVVIVGGGTAGVGVAAQLRNKANVTLIEPRHTHFYQPMWTLVGGGLKNNTQSAKPMAQVIPRGVEWVKDAAASFDPERNTVTTAEGKELKYDYLVVATGIETHFDRIEGLQDTIGKNGVISIYDYTLSQDAQEAIRGTKSGNLIFTQHADSAIKCGGAPQKIMWLAEDLARRNGFRDNVKMHWFAPQPAMFPVKKYGDILNNMADEKKIERHHGLRLVKVDGAKQKATFEEKSNPANKVVMDFSLLHVIPFMCPPKSISSSPLADAKGFVDVDKHTLQHKKYSNVFALGDSSNLPTSKTMAAIAKQAPILVFNLLAHKDGRELTASYDGYTSCPITVARNKLLLAEFKYGGELAETFPFLQSQPRGVFMFFKETLFPLAYFELYLRGLWYGPRTIFPPSFKQQNCKD